MESSTAHAPPYLATPLQLSPFVGLTISPDKVGEHAAARATARPYRDVAARIRRWQHSGRITADESPAIYLHEYTADGLTVRGLVGALGLDRRAHDVEDRAIFPHEGVYEAQSEQLVARMAQMRLNPAPILLVHRGPAELRRLVAEVATSDPYLEFTDRSEQHHRIWAVRDPDQLAAIEAGVALSRPLIADGHHRYAAYLRLQRQHPGTDWDEGLAMLIDQDDTPLFLGAIHRVLAKIDLSMLTAALADTPHSLEITSRTDALDSLSATTLVATDGRSWGSLRLHLETDRAAVQALHEEIVPRLGLTAPIGYHHSVETTLAALRRRNLAVLLPAPTFEQVHDTVTRDHLLPQKATSFQPKPSVGVLMRSLGE